MPIWLQLAAAVSAALASGIMGAALVPFLQKQRFCEPDSPSSQERESTSNRMRPTMGGILLVFGTLFGMTLSYTLYRTFCVVDSTSLSVQQETKELLLAVGYALVGAAAGFWMDFRLVRRRQLVKQPAVLRFAAVFLITALLLYLCDMDSTVLEFGFWRYDAGFLYVPLTAVSGSLLWMSASSMEEETDGVSISAGGIVLLGMTLLLMQEMQYLHALHALTAAGACMGCLVWNLHPAKCRLGRTGIFWLSGMVTAVCLLYHQHFVLLLMTAVYLINPIPSWRKQGMTLQAHLRRAGLKPWQQIAVLAGFAGICSAAAVMVCA